MLYAVPGRIEAGSQLGVLLFEGGGVPGALGLRCRGLELLHPRFRGLCAAAPSRHLFAKLPDEMSKLAKRDQVRPFAVGHPIPPRARAAASPCDRRLPCREGCARDDGTSTATPRFAAPREGRRRETRRTTQAARGAPPNSLG